MTGHNRCQSSSHQPTALHHTAAYGARWYFSSHCNHRDEDGDLINLVQLAWTALWPLPSSRMTSFGRVLDLTILRRWYSAAFQVLFPELLTGPRPAFAHAHRGGHVQIRIRRRQGRKRANIDAVEGWRVHTADDTPRRNAVTRSKHSNSTCQGDIRPTVAAGSSRCGTTQAVLAVGTKYIKLPWV